MMLCRSQSAAATYCRCYCQSTSAHCRTNPVGIQMLSDAIRKQLFGDSIDDKVLSNDLMHKIESHLKHHGLWNKNKEILPEVEFQLPAMQGKNLVEHFHNITMKQVSPYIKLADQLSEYKVPPAPNVWKHEKGWHRYSRDGTVDRVPYPDETACVFDVETLVNGNYPVMATAVSHEAWYSWCSDRLINDNFIYSLRPPMHKELVPMESDLMRGPESVEWVPRLVIGHNVGFDRSYIQEQYYIKGSKMKFLDTMAMHIALHGFTGFQRVLYNAKKRGKSLQDLKNKRNPASKYTTNSRLEEEAFEWMSKGSLNSLHDVYKHHCNGEELDKASRDTFVKGTIQDINGDFQNLMTYCSADVIATLKVFQKLWPEFRVHFPSPVTLAGMLELGTAYLPVNSNWNRYIEVSDQHYFANQDEISASLKTIATDVSSKYAKNSAYKSDPWLYDLDWTAPSLKLLKAPRKVKEGEEPTQIDENLHPVVRKVLETANRLPKIRPHMAGVPRWYSEQCQRIKEDNFQPGPTLLTLTKRTTSKILKLTWDGYPLYFDSKYGWGYVVPDKDDVPEHLVPSDKNSEMEAELLYPYREARRLTYFRSEAEQSAADHASVGSGFEDFSPLIDSNLEGHSLTYKHSENIWNKVRFMSEHQKALFFEKTRNGDGTEMPSWHKGNGPVKDVKIHGGWFFKLPHKNGNHLNVGNPLSKDFLSQIISGTLSSAAGSDAIKVLTLSIRGSYWKNNRDRIRSQMVTWLDHAHLPDCVERDDSYNPDGLYGAILPRIVSAGTVTRRAVEKTWLTASNAKVDRIGSELKAMIQSPPGYHFVGADVDSQELWIASLIGDTHFAGIHGCTAIGWMTLQGTKAEGTDVHSKTASLVGISRDEAKVFNYGRIYGAGKMFAEKLLLNFSHRLTEKEARAKADVMYKATKGIKSRGKPAGATPSQGKLQWSGGSESEMFNGLEATALSDDPRTPVLRCKITQSLQPQNVHSEFMTSRINWVVQSSAVDYLHLMLVCMRWLFEEFEIDGRFCISIHDEVRYLVKSEDRHRAALALHVTNLYTRAMFAHKMGINDLPQSVAFFSGVDIDKCLRKESTLDCKTPSNPHAMEGSYRIPPGETLDIYETLKLTHGSLRQSV